MSKQLEELVIKQKNPPKWVLICNDGHSTGALGLFGNRKLANTVMEEFITEAIRDFKDDSPEVPIVITRTESWQDSKVVVNDVTWQTELVQETFR